MLAQTRTQVNRADDKGPVAWPPSVRWTVQAAHRHNRIASITNGDGARRVSRLAFLCCTVPGQPCYRKRRPRLGIEEFRRHPEMMCQSPSNFAAPRAARASSGFASFSAVQVPIASSHAVPKERPMHEFEKIEILLAEDSDADAEMTIRALRRNNLANHLVWVKDGA